MIDHLLRFESEAAAHAALPDYWLPADDTVAASWRSDICIPDVSVTVGQARTPVKGWFILIALPAEDAALRQKARLIIDRDTRRVVYLRPDLPIAERTSTRIEPVFAGTETEVAR